MPAWYARLVPGFGRTGQTTAAVEIDDAGFGTRDLALQAPDFRSEQGTRGHRGVAVGFEIGDLVRRFAGEILAAAVERGSGADLEIGDAGVSGLEPAAFLLVLRDGKCQRPLAALDGGCRIAHLLIEDEKGIAALQFFSRYSHAAPEERQNCFEHLQLPVMSIAHELDIAAS